MDKFSSTRKIIKLIYFSHVTKKEKRKKIEEKKSLGFACNDTVKILFFSVGFSSYTFH